MPASNTPFPILIAALLMAALSGCKTKEQDDPRTRPALVRIATVGAAQLGDHTYTGIVTARVQSDLGFRVPGKATKRFVNVGQTVRAGQPLMRIVEAAKAKAEQASADEARYRGLVGTGAVLRTESNTARTQGVLHV